MGERTVLVTGGTGTLGRHVVRELRSQDVAVRVLSRTGGPGRVEADLATGVGVTEACRGIDTVIHCATSPTRPDRVDVEGTRRLVAAAAGNGVGHLVYISIVGVDRNPFSYYRAKLKAEAVVTSGQVPWTILRATQFHDLVHGILQTLARVPRVMPVPAMRLQPVDAAEVGRRLSELALAGPAGRVPDVGGPQVRRLAELAGTFLDHVGLDRRIVEVPLPGAAARAFRSGAQVPTHGVFGGITWQEYLAVRR